MAFKDTSGTAVIDAVLTDIGRKRMADGTFRPIKFALGDDEIDYALIGPDALITDGATNSLSGSAMFEAFGSDMKNIQYGLNTFASPNTLYHPILKLNTKIGVAAQISGSRERVQQLENQTGIDGIGSSGGTAATAESFYLAVNDETADKMRQIFTGSAGIDIAGTPVVVAPPNSKFFKFLEDRNFEGTKIIIESGLDNIPIEEEYQVPVNAFGDSAATGDSGAVVEGTAWYAAAFGGLVSDTMYIRLPVAIDYQNRIKYLVKRNHLDRHYFVMADNRFIEKVIGPSRNCSSFKNFADGSAEINFQTSLENVPITYMNQFDDYYTFLVDGVPNMMFDHEMYTYPSTKYSSLLGPKGTVTALNFAIVNKLKVNSSGERDYRYSKYGEIDQTLFDSSHKFDYIETIVYVIGATTDSRIQIPLRLLRYVGT